MPLFRPRPASRVTIGIDYCFFVGLSFLELDPRPPRGDRPSIFAAFRVLERTRC